MAKTKFSEKSALRKSVQPILIGICLIVIAYIAYKAYVAVQNAMKSAQESLKKRGISIDGSQAKLKVKGIDDARYLDETQRALVNAWNNSETKGYYSRLWSKEDARKAGTGKKA